MELLQTFSFHKLVNKTAKHASKKVYSVQFCQNKSYLQINLAIYEKSKDNASHDMKIIKSLLKIHALSTLI